MIHTRHVMYHTLYIASIFSFLCQNSNRSTTVFDIDLKNKKFWRVNSFNTMIISILYDLLTRQQQPYICPSAVQGLPEGSVASTPATQSETPVDFGEVLVLEYMKCI